MRRSWLMSSAPSSRNSTLAGGLTNSWTGRNFAPNERWPGALEALGTLTGPGAVSFFRGRVGRRGGGGPESPRRDRLAARDARRDVRVRRTPRGERPRVEDRSPSLVHPSGAHRRRCPEGGAVT